MQLESADNSVEPAQVNAEARKEPFRNCRDGPHNASAPQLPPEPIEKSGQLSGLKVSCNHIWKFCHTFSWSSLVPWSTSWVSMSTAGSRAWPVWDHLRGPGLEKLHRLEDYNNDCNQRRPNDQQSPDAVDRYWLRPRSCMWEWPQARQRRRSCNSCSFSPPSPKPALVKPEAPLELTNSRSHPVIQHPHEAAVGVFYPEAERAPTPPMLMPEQKERWGCLAALSPKLYHSGGATLQENHGFSKREQSHEKNCSIRGQHRIQEKLQGATVKWYVVAASHPASLDQRCVYSRTSRSKLQTF